MPVYRFRYVCETSLKTENEIHFEYRGNQILFSSSQEDVKRNRVHASLDVEAPSWREADVKAQSFLQPVLDALAFATGTPLLILHWNFVLKDESGSNTRRALLCEKREQSTPFFLTQIAINEAQTILSTEDGPELALCWHRYALQRELIPDRFLFQWLAFEGLAGTHQIPTTCPKCSKEVTHCEVPLSHSGSDRDKAHDLLLRVEPGITREKFKKEVWGRDRNSVFHGSKYPGPEFLARLNTLSPKLKRACESEISRRCNLTDRPRPTGSLEVHIYKYNMFGWQTNNPQDRFAADFPWESVKDQFGDARNGDGYDPNTSTFELLNFVKESVNW